MVQSESKSVGTENTLRVAEDMVISVSCRLFDAQNQPLTDQIVFDYLHGGYGDILDKIEEALTGQNQNFETLLHLEPEEAFGHYDAKLIRIVSRSQFDHDVEEGMCFMEEGDDDEQERVFSVTDVTPNSVVMDANHPLAGLALRFELKVIRVRPASKEEVQQGSAFLLESSGDDVVDLRGFRRQWNSMTLNPSFKRTIH